MSLFQVLSGDVEEAICCHALYYAIWKRYEALPERFNWRMKEPDVLFYPLRPELVESTYLLYQATKNPFYLHVGREILQSINRHARTHCGYASLHNVVDKSQEDRMESFFLSETCKYLFLLFDHENPVNNKQLHWIFTTEGHLLKVGEKSRNKPWEDSLCFDSKQTFTATIPVVRNCSSIPLARTFGLPLRRNYLNQVDELVGLNSWQYAETGRQKACQDQAKADYKSLYRPGDLEHEMKRTIVYEQQQPLKIDLSIRSLMTFAFILLSSVHLIVTVVQFLRDLIFRRRRQAWHAPYHSRIKLPHLTWKKLLRFNLNARYYANRLRLHSYVSKIDGVYYRVAIRVLSKSKPVRISKVKTGLQSFFT